MIENREIHEVYARRKIKFIKYEAVATSCDCLVFVFPKTIFRSFLMI